MYAQELKHLGLKEKEAAVYIACLQLGPSPVQVVARKAKVVRATTYVVLEALMSMGLVTRYKEGKKTLFSAEPPRQLGRLLEKQEEEIIRKKQDLDELLPELQILMKTEGGRPTVRYFDGKEGLHAIRQEIVMYAQPGDTVYNFTPTDHLNAIFPANQETLHRQRASRGIKSKTLAWTKSSSLESMLKGRGEIEDNERRFVDPKRFNFTSGMTVYRDRIAIGSFSGSLGGVVIESQTMADMMRGIFHLAWDGAGLFDNGA